MERRRRRADGDDAAHGRHRVQHRVGRRAVAVGAPGGAATAVLVPWLRRRSSAPVRARRHAPFHPRSWASCAGRSTRYHRDTDEPITLVAESEGALLAKAYVAATPHAPVRNLVVVSPLVEPGRVYYPPADGEGWGVFGKFEMEGLSWALGGLSPVTITPDTPFLRSIVDDAPALQHPDVMPVAGRPPGRRPPARHRGERARAAADRDPLHGGARVPRRHARRRIDGGGRRARCSRAVRCTEHEGWSLTEGVIQAGASAWQVAALDHRREPRVGSGAGRRRLRRGASPPAVVVGAHALAVACGRGRACYSAFDFPWRLLGLLPGRARAGGSRASRCRRPSAGSASENGTAYSSQPFGATFSRLPRMARKIFAFSSP